MPAVKEVLISALVAAVLIIAAATSVFAQAAVQEPVAFAFSHPNADVLNAGRGAYRSFGSANGYYGEVSPAPRFRHRPAAERHHRATR